MIKKREINYEVIRIVSCFLVIINHTIWIVESRNTMFNSIWMISQLLFLICKTAVPLFVMLSGALLLRKDNTYRDIFKNKILKIISVIVIWSLIFEIYETKQIFSINELFIQIKQIIIEPKSIHLWYLYMLIGLYMMTPFIRKMVKNFENNDFILFIVIWIVYSSLLPYLNIFKTVEYSSFFSLPLFSGFIGYFITGYYLNNLDLNKKNNTLAIIGLLSGLIIAMLTTIYFSKQQGYTSKILDNVHIFPIMLMSCSLFIIMKKVGNWLNNKINSMKIRAIITDIGSKTFGIYLIHLLVGDIVLKSKIFGLIFNDQLNDIMSLIILNIVIFMLSYIIIYIISKTPIIKKII